MFRIEALSVCLFVPSSSEILKHEDLEGKIKTACLGSLLLQDHLNLLEDQYLAHKEVKTGIKLLKNVAIKLLLCFLNFLEAEFRTLAGFLLNVSQNVVFLMFCKSNVYVP